MFNTAGLLRLPQLDCAWVVRDGSTDLMTWTCALMTRVLDTVKPSSTLFSSMNFFQPQSCSFLQNLCSVSAGPAHKLEHHDIPSCVGSA